MRGPNAIPRLLSPLACVAVLGVGLLSLGACKAPEYPACKKDKHCKAELAETCVEGTCQNCKVDEDCAGKGEGGVDWKCLEFRCADPNAAGGASGTGELGAPCAQLSDCVGGFACKAGACANCSDDMDCTPRTCNLDTGRCSAEGACQTDDQCPVDEICDGGICIFSGDYADQAGQEVCGIASIFFGFDSDKITDANMTKLKDAASCLTGQEKSLILEAHADNVGTQEYNILLTDKRGNSIKNLLVELGVPEDRVQVIGKGSLQAEGNDEATRAKDRRVDFIWQ